MYIHIYYKYGYVRMYVCMYVYVCLYVCAQMSRSAEEGKGALLKLQQVANSKEKVTVGYRDITWDTFLHT